MRILLLTQVLPYPPDSGPKVKTWNLLKCLAPHHAITLVSFVRGDQSSDVRRLAEYCEAVHGVPLRRSRRADLWHLLRSVLTGQPFMMVRDDCLAMRRALDQLTARTRFDVVHADQLNMAQYAQRVPYARRVLDAHNALWLLYQRFHQTMAAGPRKWLIGRDWRLLKRYEGQVCRGFDATLAVSDDDAEALEEAMGERAEVTVIPIGVDLQELPMVMRRRGANHIVHIGTMYWPPNVDAVRWFIEHVYPHISAARPDVVFDVVGARPPRALRALARPESGINITGHVEDPSHYLEHAGAFVVPLRAGGGMRVKILNALAQGLPVVSTTMGCRGIAVEPGRHVLVADTPADFADSVLRVLNDDPLAAQLGRNGRQLVETRYDYRRLCPQVLDVYRAVCVPKLSGAPSAGSLSDVVVSSDPTRPPDPFAEGFGPQAEASGVRAGSGPSAAGLRSAEPQAGPAEQTPTAGSSPSPTRASASRCPPRS